MYPCSTKTREVLGNLEGGGDGFPNSSRVLVEYGHSPIINLSAENPSLWVGKDWHCQFDSVKINPSLLIMREWSFSPRRSCEFMWHLKQLNLSSTQTQPLIPQSTPTHACAQWKWIFGNFLIQCSSPLAKFARSSRAKEIDSKDCKIIKKRERKRTLSSTSLGARIQWRVSPPSMNHFDNWKFWSSNDGKTYCVQVRFRNSCSWWWLKVRGWSLVMTNGRRRKRLMIRRWNGPVRCDPLVTLITLVRMRLSARKKRVLKPGGMF